MRTYIHKISVDILSLLSSLVLIFSLKSYLLPPVFASFSQIQVILTFFVVLATLNSGTALSVYIPAINHQHSQLLAQQVAHQLLFAWLILLCVAIYWIPDSIWFNLVGESSLVLRILFISLVFFRCLNVFKLDHYRCSTDIVSCNAISNLRTILTFVLSAFIISRFYVYLSLFTLLVIILIIEIIVYLYRVYSINLSIQLLIEYLKNNTVSIVLPSIFKYSVLLVPLTLTSTYLEIFVRTQLFNSLSAQISSSVFLMLSLGKYFFVFVPSIQFVFLPRLSNLLIKNKSEARIKIGRTYLIYFSYVFLILPLLAYPPLVKVILTYCGMPSFMFYKIYFLIVASSILSSFYSLTTLVPDIVVGPRYHLMSTILAILSIYCYCNIYGATYDAFNLVLIYPLYWIFQLTYSLILSYIYSLLSYCRRYDLFFFGSLLSVCLGLNAYAIINPNYSYLLIAISSLGLLLITVINMLRLTKSTTSP